ASEEHATLAAPVLELTFAPTLPKRPSFFTVVEGTGAALDLAWVDNTSTETGFEIERRDTGGSFAALTTTAADATAFSDGTTTLGTTYEYRVRATAPEGVSAWTPVVAGTAGGSTGPIPGERLNFVNWASNRGISDNPAKDDDSDGVANLIEYAATAPSQGETVVGGEKFLTLTFARRVAATDVALVVEAADAPTGPWEALDPLQPENQVRVRANVPEQGWETVEVRDRVPMSQSSRRFMRLNVSTK
ncbi:MAG: fibronectin type III domain-containing protein, partial [Verrucomicrobiaceae bacterium]|nr:fibronectin type III domain-containing protein [Verrucomicrobiaceae bacterium]